MSRTRSYTDGQLALAVAESHSWRGVLRALGLGATGAGQIRSVRRRAERLELDVLHFTGQRGWTDAQLRDAVAACSSWQEVHDRLGLEHVAAASLRGHAARLGVPATHLELTPSVPDVHEMTPDPIHLRRAGSLLAAAWFTACGSEVSWPLEPCRYDLLVRRGPETTRVQVKTTTRRVGATWMASLVTTQPRRTYSPDEVDDFFIVDGDGGLHLIPVEVVGGLQAISLASYAAYRLPPIFPTASPPSSHSP